MRKILALLLVFLLVFLFVSCQTEPAEVSETSPSVSASEITSEPSKSEKFQDVSIENWKQIKEGNAATGGMGNPYFYVYSGNAVVLFDLFVETLNRGDELATYLKDCSAYNNSHITEQTDFPPRDVMQMVQNMNIAKEEFIRANDVYIERVGSSEDRPFTDEEVELIYSGDHAAFVQHYILESAFYHNGKAYAPYWFAKHGYEDWVKENFNANDLADFLNKSKGRYWEENWKIIEARLREYQKDTKQS